MVRRYFLGVDGGQTATKALIGDESGHVTGAGQSGPCNHVGGPEGHEKFLSAINGCMSEACLNAGLNPTMAWFEVACLGFSGGAADKEAVLREIIRAHRMVVTHDALIALAGATAGEPGIIAIAGTGSIAFGRNGAGQMARAGGWGYLFGDEGGGFDLVRQALRAALRYEEGWGLPTALYGTLLKATGAANANELMHRFYTAEFPRPRIAGFARLVDQAAREGDAVAREILNNAGQQLATLVTAVRAQLFQTAESATVSYAGGVFQSAILLERYHTLVGLEENNQFRAPAHPPVVGALLEAYHQAGVRPDLKPGTY